MEPGDVMEMTVYGEKDLSKNYKVNGAGSISVPLIGEVQIAELNVGCHPVFFIHKKTEQSNQQKCRNKDQSAPHGN